MGHIRPESIKRALHLNADTKELGVRHFSRFSRSGPSAPPAEPDFAVTRLALRPLTSSGQALSKSARTEAPCLRRQSQSRRFPLVGNEIPSPESTRRRNQDSYLSHLLLLRFPGRGVPEKAIHSRSISHNSIGWRPPGARNPMNGNKTSTPPPLVTR